MLKMSNSFVAALLEVQNVARSCLNHSIIQQRRGDRSTSRQLHYGGEEQAILHAQALNFVDKANTTPTISDPIFSKHL